MQEILHSNSEFLSMFPKQVLREDVAPRFPYFIIFNQDPISGLKEYCLQRLADRIWNEEKKTGIQEELLGKSNIGCPSFDSSIWIYIKN